MMGPFARASLAKKARNTLTECRALAAESRWGDIVALTRNMPKVLSAQPEIAMHRLSAAAELKDRRGIDDVVRFAHTLDGESASKFALVRELARVGRAADAAQILMNDQRMQGVPRFFKALPIVAKNLDDKSLKQSLFDLANQVSNGGMEIRPTKAHFAFRKQVPPDCPTGSVTVRANADVPAHHRPALEEIAAKYVDDVAGGRQPIVQQYDDVFVDRWGQIWKEDGRLIAPGGRPLPSVTSHSVKTVEWGLNLTGATRGIYHWMIDKLPELAFLTDGAPGTEAVRLLTSDRAAPFAMATLDTLGLKDRVETVGDAVFVRHLLVSRVGFRGCVGWSHVQSVFGPLVDHALSKVRQTGVALSDRVYISRRDAKRRVMTNEHELEADLVARGFTVWEFSKIPLWHQIALINQASVVVAPHGAGLAHIVHAQPGARVVEILPIRDGTYQLRFNYARLSIIKGLRYSAWLEDQNPAVDGWAVGREAFIEHLDHILA